jgi:hypothetical protein
MIPENAAYPTPPAEPVTRAVRALLSRQHADGSFDGTGRTGRQA